MKIISKILFLLFIAATSVSNNMEIYFMNANFNSPKTPYFETYLSFIGNSLNFVETENNSFQAAMEITTIIKKNDEVVMTDKYTLKSPEVFDTTINFPNFIDQQRYMLDDGEYTVEIAIEDINSDFYPVYFIDEFEIDYKDDELQFSSIQLIESAKPTQEEGITTKSNFDLVPYVSNFYPHNLHSLMFYLEIYNSDKIINDDYIIKYYIKGFESRRAISSISRFRRMTPQSINPIIGELNIETLGSGNYELIIEIINRDNELVKSKSLFFQRSNYVVPTEEDALADIGQSEFVEMFDYDVDDTDSLVEYIYSMRPIANSDEQRFIDYRAASAPKRVLQDFFYEFWVAREPSNPNNSWRVYKEQVDFVNRSFSSLISNGYNTDRGRVYLQYGTPNDVYVSDFEPSAFPYEIWYYNKVGNERNRRFVFYNPSLVGDEYQLLHSEVTGEIKNPNWERLLHRRNHTIYDFDQRHSDDHWGGRARDEFRR